MMLPSIHPLFLIFVTTSLLLLCCFISKVEGECENGCSSRGLCINNQCVCAEGLSGPSCSDSIPYTLPTFYDCPQCYSITVGTPRYYSGPYWRFPDTPIVTLNYKGTLSTYMSNSNAVLVAKGDDIEDWLPSFVEVLDKGEEGQFDSCGAWLIRVINGDDGRPIGFYHSETACDYENNGQTRKSGGYSVSNDGGLNYTKVNYPNNKIIDSPSPLLIGRPSGEGDYSVVALGDYYYLLFSNVDSDFIGVARAPRTSGALPGSFLKYLNGNWDSPAVGGASTALQNIAGPIASIHTPSSSFLAVGNVNQYYWNEGIMMSASNDAINWLYFGDPIVTPDPISLDLRLYASFLGPTGGYDIGNSFKFFYMWLPPYKTLSYRYQIYKDIKISYVGPNNTDPSTKIALTTFISPSGEIWQSTELALPPHRALDIVGYLMSRPYPLTFPVYDCVRTALGDHFIGTADQCIFVPNIQALRQVGYMWSTRVAHSIAVYQCTNDNDLYLSTSFTCGRGTRTQRTAFGYMMSGPQLSGDISSRETVVWQGATWRYTNDTPPTDWYKKDFDDSGWLQGNTPFSNGYSNEMQATPFGNMDYYIRRQFTIADRPLEWVLLSVASDNTASVYINDVLVDTDPAVVHEAAYWNRQIYVPTSTFTSGLNVIAVLAKNADQYAYFDLQITAKYISQEPPAAPVCNPPCGVMGQCGADGTCSCEDDWGGSTCNYNKCKYQASSTQVVVQPGAQFYYLEWTYVPTTPGGWFASLFDPSAAAWPLGTAPFGTSNYNPTTVITPTRHLFRKTFQIEVPDKRVISSAALYIASDDTHRVYINGIFLGAQIFPSSTHTAQYWNDEIYVDASVLKAGDNTIAVEIPLLNGDVTGFFDMQLNVTFSKKNC